MSKAKILNTRGRILTEKELLRMEIGMRIRRERTLWNMTQEELSSLLGISPNYLGQIERGNRDLSRKIEDRLCELFSLSRADFTADIGNIDWSFDISENGGIFHDLNESDLMRLLKSCSPEELQFCGHILRSTLHYLRTLRHPMYDPEDTGSGSTPEADSVSVPPETDGPGSQPADQGSGLPSDH